MNHSRPVEDRRDMHEQLSALLMHVSSVILALSTTITPVIHSQYRLQLL